MRTCLPGRSAGEVPEAFVAGASGYTGPGSQASPRASAFLIAATRRGGVGASYIS